MPDQYRSAAREWKGRRGRRWRGAVRSSGRSRLDEFRFASLWQDKMSSPHRVLRQIAAVFRRACGNLGSHGSPEGTAMVAEFRGPPPHDLGTVEMATAQFADGNVELALYILDDW